MASNKNNEKLKKKLKFCSMEIFIGMIQNYLLGTFLKMGIMDHQLDSFMVHLYHLAKLL